MGLFFIVVVIDGNIIYFNEWWLLVNNIGSFEVIFIVIFVVIVKIIFIGFFINFFDCLVKVVLFIICLDIYMIDGIIIMDIRRMVYIFKMIVCINLLVFI